MNPSDFFSFLPLVFSLILLCILPVFWRRLFVLCCPSRKPVAYILSSKHRTPLCSAVFKALIKGRLGPEWDGWRGASVATANGEPSQYRAGRSASLGPVVARSTGAWPTVREGLSFPLRGTVKCLATKGAPNNKGSTSAAPQIPTYEQTSRRRSFCWLFTMVIVTQTLDMHSKDGCTVETQIRPSKLTY